MASHTDAPAVAVIVPTYQRRELVRRAVATVLAQTFSDFELIVVDDGSSDGTDTMLAGVDARLRYVWQENAGVAAARNRALDVARAPVVTFLDSDNRWLPDHLETVVELLARHPAAVVASTCPRFAIAGRESLADATVADPHEQLFAAGGHAGYLSCVAMRRATVEAVGRFDPRIGGGEDTDLLLRLATQGPFATIRRVTVVRHPRPGTLTDSARRSGGYLAGTERAALNLVALAERLPGRERLAGEAQGLVHVCRAVQALDRGAAATAHDELAEAVRRLPVLSEDPAIFVERVRVHLPAAHDRRVLLRALTITAEQWPDPSALTARLARVLAVATALRTACPRAAARLVAGRVRGGNARLVWRQRALLWDIAVAWRRYRRRQAGV